MSRTQKWDSLETMYRDESPMLHLVLEGKCFKDVVPEEPVSLPDPLTPGTQKPGQALQLTLSLEH